MKKSAYTLQTCSNCIMDESDVFISFNNDGLCDYCVNFELNIKPIWCQEGDDDELRRMADKIRANRSHSDFDCIIGLSGGLDSSYVAYVAVKKMGLLPLLFHVDAGWNSVQAVSNIEKLVDSLGLDLFTEVINWEEMKDLQVSFLKSGIPDQDMPQDIAFFSALYRFARKHGIKTILTGGNFSTECCREPEAWGAYPGIDSYLVKDIHSRFGSVNLDSFPLIDIFTYKIFYKYIYGLNVYHPLNFVRYLKQDAESELSDFCGWQSFKHKHHESRFTRFYEDYWLPRKFGFDKRRAHFSSLILTGQMTRDQALERVTRPEMDENFLKREFEFVAHKLGLTVDELQAYFEMPNKTFRDYNNKRSLIGLGASLMRKLGLEKRYFR